MADFRWATGQRRGVVRSGTLRAAAGMLLGFAALGLHGACTEEKVDPVQPIYVLPASFEELAQETFFDHPFPSDLRLEDGRVRFAGWPNPRQVPLLDEYIGFIDKRLDGFSPVAAGFLRFDGPIDPKTLPAPEETRSATASVQLIDIGDGPTRFERQPIYLTWRRDPGVYWVENTLAFGPIPGYPLLHHHAYALVVTDAVRAADGHETAASPTLREALGLAKPTSDPAEKAQAALAPAVAAVKDAGIDLEHVVHFTAFTTDDPTEEYLAAADDLPNQIEAPAPHPGAWEVHSNGAYFDEYWGSYGPTPNFQVGQAPYPKFGDGGGFELSADGVPQMQDEFHLRFSLSVPKRGECPPPPDGYPIVMFAHGTGGDYRSYVNDGSARSLASECIASMGVDQIFHGTRPGTPEDGPNKETQIEILFFNFNNIEAARTNIRQSGLDEVQRARLFTETHMTVPAALSLTGDEIAFDASKLMFFGHSQGSLNGPLFLAASDAPRGAVLSGASSVLQITLLEKTQPEPSVATLVKTVFLQLLLDEQEEVGLLYPPIALAQSIVDPVDPGNYARYIVREPHLKEGATTPNSPKSIYMTEGVGPDGTGDSFAPPRGCEALGITLGLPLMNPVVHDPTDALEGDLVPTTIPDLGLSGNLAGGAASGMLAQWQPTTGDGHFVVFDIPEATRQAARFLRNLADDPKGRVPAL